MEIRALGSSGSLLSNVNKSDTHLFRVSKKNISNERTINYDEQIINSSEELADMVSSSGRNRKISRNNVGSENDAASHILEENADEKIELLIKQVSQLPDYRSILNYARQLFPNDCDLLQVLRELLLRRQLSEIKKRRVKESIEDLEKFGDKRKTNSSLNVGRVAKRYSDCKNGNNVSAKDLRNSYLRFLELELPASFIYQDWIDEYGYRNRKRMLSFILSALVADMKASEPGIHSREFGPLSAKLSDTRVLHTLDIQLIASFGSLAFSTVKINEKNRWKEGDILNVFLTGLMNYNDLHSVFNKFSHDFMSFFLARQQAMVIQIFRNSYNLTPCFLYADDSYRDMVIDFFSLLMQPIYKKERSSGIWKRYF